MDFCKKISQKVYKNRNSKIIKICNQNRDLKEQANWMYICMKISQKISKNRNLINHMKDNCIVNKNNKKII